MEEIVSALQTEIEARLATAEPEVEVLLAEVASGSTLRLFIDHPDGVTLALCERVSGHLGDYRRAVLARGLLARPRPAADQAPALHPLPRPRARVRLRDATEGHQVS